MKTGTAIILIVALLIWADSGGIGSGQVSTVKKEPASTTTANPAGDTFSSIMNMISATAGAVKSGIEASSQRA